jgi:hypothetical protein
MPQLRGNEPILGLNKGKQEHMKYLEGKLNLQIKD